MSVALNASARGRQEQTVVGALVRMVRAVGAVPSDHAVARPHVMILRFALVNLFLFGVVGVLALHGHIGRAVEADASGLVQIIAAVFVAGLVVCGYRIAEIGRELDCAREGDTSGPSRAADYVARVRGLEPGQQAMAAANLRLTLASRIAVVRYIANSLVLLGLIGTVVGFIIALSGVDPSTVSDIQAVSPMVAELVAGMSVALYTTLVGAALHLWLTVNYQILAAGAVDLIDALVRLGERHAGS